MLRISKSELSKIKKDNRRIKYKINRLKNTFNIKVDFQVKKPNEFTTRTELNKYKEDSRVFLAPYTHKYVKMGYSNRNPKYFVGIPYREYQMTKRMIDKQNRYAKRMMNRVEKIPLTVAGSEQFETTASHMRNQAPPHKLNTALQQYYPLHMNKEQIHSPETFRRFAYGVKHFHTGNAYYEQNLRAKENFCEALYNTFGENSINLINVINSLTPSEFSNLYESEIFIDFDYIYDLNYATILLNNISKGVIKYFANSNVMLDKRYKKDEFVEMMNKLQETIGLDSADILSQYNPHSYTFYDKGNNALYQGNLRKRDVEQIKKGNISQDILKKSHRVK